MSLSFERIHQIRTSGYTDSHWSRRLRKTIKTIRAARTGLTHSDHPTPPDLRPRGSYGRYSSKYKKPAKRRRPRFGL